MQDAGRVKKRCSSTAGRGIALGEPALGAWLQTAFSHPRGEPFRHLPMHAADVEILQGRV